MFFLAVCLLTTACGSLPTLKKNPTAKELFQHAVKLKERSYYKDALAYFRRLKNRYLYSRFTKSAELAVADIYFAQEEWVKAVKAYAGFAELYPRHPEIDRVVFRLALSYFHQLPTTEDRDLQLSKKALFYLNSHLTQFPKSPYKNQTREHKQKVLKLLAKKEWMIARFHLHQGKPLSALPYLKKLIKDYAFLLTKEKPSAQKPGAGKNKTANTGDLPGAKKTAHALPSLKELQKLKKDLQKKAQNQSQK